MIETILITGGHGFLGRHVDETAGQTHPRPIKCGKPGANRASLNIQRARTRRMSNRQLSIWFGTRKGRFQTKYTRLTREFIYERCVIDGLDFNELAAEIGCDPATVRWRAGKFGIRHKRQRPPPKPRFTHEHDDEIVRMYVVDDLTAREIGPHFGVDEKMISCRLRSLGIPTKRRTKQDLSIDLTGREFGRLTVIERAERRKSEYRWICRCKCGTTTTTPARSLLSEDEVHATRSCGCMHYDIDWEIIPPWRWRRISLGAAKRGFEFSITREFAEDLFRSQHGRCALSGVELQFSRKSKGQQRRCTASLDRIENGIGYTENNVQWVHKRINTMKHVLSDAEFVEICRTVVAYQDSKC